MMICFFTLSTGTHLFRKTTPPITLSTSFMWTLTPTRWSGFIRSPLRPKRRAQMLRLFERFNSSTPRKSTYGMKPWTLSFKPCATKIHSRRFFAMKFPMIIKLSSLPGLSKGSVGQVVRFTNTRPDSCTVRLLFVLTVAQQLKSTTIDFNAAFVQSELPEPIYLELPPGYSSAPGEDKVYKVVKSLYGDIRAAKLWYKHLSSALVDKMGFRKSSIDSCLFLRDALIFAFYVDDGIIVSSNDQLIVAFIDELRECRINLGVEDDYAGYLGVDIIMQPDGSILMRQTGLIERILADFGLSDSTSTKQTPAAEILTPHKDSPPLDHTVINYRSSIGKIMYLASNTRCELTVANHQCSRFSNDPRVPHGKALKRIARYLLGTRDKGMIIRPTNDLTLDCYADADYAGVYSSWDPNDPKSVKSRTGFVIILGGIPVAWVSRLQVETALSTMEAEYIALSQALRVLIPLRIVLDEVTTALNLKQDPHSSIKSTIFEDNQACLLLATSDPPKMTPRSKSIAVKYHWFREHLEPGVIDIMPIASEDQLADIFTKPLSSLPFSKLRAKLLGW